MNGYTPAQREKIGVEEQDAHFGNTCPAIPDWTDPSDEHERVAQMQRRKALIAALREKD